METETEVKIIGKMRPRKTKMRPSKKVHMKAKDEKETSKLEAKRRLR